MNRKMIWVRMNAKRENSKNEELVFEQAVEQVAASARKLIQSLVTSADPRTREAEAAKARERAVARFGER